MRCRGYKGKNPGSSIKDAEDDREGNQEAVLVVTSPL